MESLSLEIWSQFCITAAITDSNDTGMVRRLKGTLKEGRAALGPQWNRLMQQTGSQVAYALRKRYKLY